VSKKRLLQCDKTSQNREADLPHSLIRRQPINDLLEDSLHSGEVPVPGCGGNLKLKLRDPHSGELRLDHLPVHILERREEN